MINQQKTFTKFLLTENNPFEDKRKMTKEKYINCIKLNIEPEYIAYSEEIGGEEGTFHIHVYVKTRENRSIRFTTLKKLFPYAHIDACRGSSKENRDYVFKEGKWKDSEKNLTNILESHYELGLCPPDERDKQGNRNDLLDLVDGVKNGMSNTEIVNYNPRLVTKLKDMDALRTAFLYEENRKKIRNVEVTYIYGDTGSGKSRYVLEKYGFENVYRVTDYKHPFDNYQTEDVIVFEEFRNSIKIEQMLNYLDIYPMTLPCRYNNKQACFTKIYILSNWDYYSQYAQLRGDSAHRDTYEAWNRRIHKCLNFRKGCSPRTIFDRTISKYTQMSIPFDDNNDDLPY